MINTTGSRCQILNQMAFFPLQSRNRATGQVAKAHLVWICSTNEVEPVPLKTSEGVSPKKNFPKMTFHRFKGGDFYFSGDPHSRNI